MINLLTVVAKVFSNTWIFLLQKNVSSLKATHTFFSAKLINIFAMFQDTNFKDTLANNFVKF